MHTHRIKSFRAIVVSAVLSAAAASNAATTRVLLDEPPTMQEVTLLLQSQKWAEAIPGLKAIVKDDSANHEALFLLSYALHASGDLDNAILVHKKVIKIPAYAAGGYYNLGCAYALKGDASDAFKALNSAIEMGVRDVAQFKGDEDLKSIQRDERWKPMLETIETLNKAETALHFWVGSWDCYDTTTGKLAGKNTLEFRVGNSVVHESWTSQDKNYAGESWNIYDRGSNTWKQTWIDSAGSLIQMEAALDHEEGDELYEGLMFEGTNTAPGKKATHVRMHVRATEDGHVIQTGFESKNRGKTWKQQYEFEYVPTGEVYTLKAED